MGMKSQKFREFHRNFAPIILLPLFITVLTGMSYRIGKSWFGLSRDQVHFLMVIHEGEYLGKILEPFYVLLNGLGVLWMLITGAILLWQNITRSHWFKRLTINRKESSTES